MTVTELTKLTKKIHDDHPKVWDKFKNFIFSSDFGINNILFDDYEIVINTEKYYKKITNGFIIPFSMFYSLLEDFFEENELDIYISYFLYSKVYHYTIRNIKNNIEIDGDWGMKTKIEAKQQGLLKACEIMEEESEDC